jgi:hypothetical protein
MRVIGGLAPRLQENRYMKVISLSALRTGRVHTQETFQVPISVRGRVDRRVIVSHTTAASPNLYTAVLHDIHYSKNRIS